MLHGSKPYPIHTYQEASLLDLPLSKPALDDPLSPRILSVQMARYYSDGFDA